MKQQFGDFTASELYCPKCRSARPVRERLLLVLPSGELFEYLCAGCGTSLGTRTVSGNPLTNPRPQGPETPRSARPNRMMRKAMLANPFEKTV